MENLIEFLHKVGELKKIKRTGWVYYKVPDPESVAEHSFRVAVMALILSEKLGFDKDKCVKMAVVHDLAESLVGDITPWDKKEMESKHENETKAMHELTARIDNEEIMKLWEEYEEGKTPEAVFVRELDKAEMFLQAWEYEEEHGKNLKEFMESAMEKVKNPELREMLENLLKKRE
jgi:putative hydrolase of HD superfamily